ncbi:MAG TPA: hypothetical protein VHP32_10565 [Ignavibacteria bacterium]|nr:hypothetical protein [Ignavibacteria bacterium]
MLKANLLILLFLSVAIYSCTDKIFTPSPFFQVIYEKPGLVDSLRGDCSASQIRTFSLGSHDLAQYDSLLFQFSNSTDADLALIQVYYPGASNYLMYLQGKSLSEISHWQIPAPDYNGEVYLRMILNSSVCTGHIYHLSVRDFKMYAR